MRRIGFGTAVILLSVVLGLCGGARGQQKLGDLVSEYGFEWLIGRWSTAVEEEQVVDVAYRWGLDRHAVMVDFRMGEYAYQGMIFYVAGEEKVVEVGVDNRGGNSVGAWEPDGEKAVSKSRRVDGDGQSREMAMVHTKVDARTMKVTLYAVEDGKLADEPWGTVEFKRQKRQAKKVTKEKAPADGAPGRFEELVKEGGFEWMIGRWAATMGGEGKIEAAFRWALQRRMVRFELSMGEYLYRGMIFYDAGSEKITEVGVDNRGSSTRGSWDVEGEKAVSRKTSVEPSGTKHRLASYHWRTDGNTLKAEVFGIRESGELADEPLGSLELERQKGQARKAKKKAGA
jgi:hypothetical protein